MSVTYPVRRFLGANRRAIAVFSLVALAIAPIQPIIFEAFADHDPFGGLPQTNVQICHFNQGQGGQYNSQIVSINSNGGNINIQGHGSHNSDIIPPFHFDDGEDILSYSGNNWNITTQSFWVNNCVTPTPTPTPSLTPTPTLTPSPTPTDSPTPTPSDSPTPTPTPTDSPTPSPTATPTPSATPEPEVRGTLTICKMIVNHLDQPITGSILGSTLFKISGFTPAVTSNPPPVAEFSEVVFATPLSYNTDLLPAFPGDDAQCVSFDDLPLGGYYYEEEEITGAGSWLTPLYNDQYEIAVTSLADFFVYDSNLFDGNPANDLARNQNTDGHFNLTEDRPERTILLLNRLPEEFEGGITVCKIVEDNTVYSGTLFSIPGIVPPVSSVLAPVGVFGTAVFTMPLTYNADILSDVPGNDAECITYNNLPLGGYHYGEETIDSDGTWDTPKYNDQFDHLISTLADFFLYDANLYDGDASNDLARNQNADGHFNLTPERPHRTIAVFNALEEINQTPTPTPTPTNSPSPTPTPSNSPTPTPTPNGGGGGGSPSIIDTPTPTPNGGSGSGSSGGSGGSSGSGGSGSPTPNILGATTQQALPEVLPATGLEDLDRITFGLFISLVLIGSSMILIGTRAPKRILSHIVIK